MKRNLLAISLFLLTISSLAQNGLESIIVEKYYISDANDAAADADGGALPVGSVTYRIFVDMLPGYKFQAAYGVPGHELKIETTTLFFNNEDRGATSPTYTKTQASRNTVMLDSWLSVGAACTGNFGVLKSEDDGVATVVNTYIPQVLQNADPLAGIPLTQQDGFIAGTPEPVTTVGISSEIAVFDNQNDGTNGPSFITSNGSWASLNGSAGPDPNSNKVLIAQITTDGALSFELNVQIGTPSGGVENYVARDPVGSEIVEPTLIYNSLISGVDASPSKSSQISVYPNPVGNSFQLSFKKQVPSASFDVYSSMGERVMHVSGYDIDSNQSIDTSTLSPGLYFVEVSAGDFNEVVKFIKL